MGAWAGQTIDQSTYLGWMSNSDGFNYFVNNVLPDILAGQATVLNPAGSNLGPKADNGTILMATTAAGSNLGLTIPQSVIEAAKNPPPPPAPTVDAPKTADPNKTARDIIQDDLTSWGLGSLTDWAMGLVTQGMNDTQVVAELRKTAEYKQRFKGNVARQDAGLTPLSESNYLSYEDQARQVMKAAGLPSGFYDSPDDFAGFIGNDTSASELNTRVQLAFSLVNQEPLEVQQQAAQLGLSTSDLAAGILDPNAALPLLQRKLQMAQIGGASVMSGYGQLGRDQLDRLASFGVDEATARKGFGNLVSLSPLLAGNAGEEDITQNEALGAQFGIDAQAQEKLSRRQRERLAQFKTDGGAAVTQKGAIGLASAGQLSA